jgi:FkbM family methyltransferase
MPALSQLPLITSVHRSLMYCLQRVGSPRLFAAYNRAWLRAGRFQRAKIGFGAAIECDLADRVPSYIFHFGHWEPNISNWIAQKLQPDDLFVDVGSNIGYYTLLASKLVGSGGRVVAIEASPKIFSRLTQAIAENACDNVRAVNIAVSDCPGRVTIYSGPPDNSGATSTRRDWRDGEVETEVSALPLDKILTPEERSRVRMIKIDVEGAEAPILRQIADTLELYSPNLEVLVECSPDNDQEEWQDLLERFARAGFSSFAIENEYTPEWYLRWRQPSPPRALSALPSGQTDVLFTRSAAVAASRSAKS